jgi:phage-related protein
MDGAISLTTMVTLAVSVPPVLVAVIVYDAEVVTAVGVPLMAPVEVSSDKPAGSDGDTEYETTVPPVEVTVAVVMAVPFVNVYEVVP